MYPSPLVREEPDNILHIVHEFLKLKPSQYFGMDFAMDRH